MGLSVMRDIKEKKEDNICIYDTRYIWLPDWFLEMYWNVLYLEVILLFWW